MKPVIEPRPWREAKRGASIEEELAGKLARAVAEPRPLDGAALERVRRAVLSGGADERAARRFVPARWRLALSVFLVLASATAVGGTTVLWRRHVVHRASPPPPVAVPVVPVQHQDHRAVRRSEPIPAPPEVREEPAPLPAETSHRRRGPETVRVVARAARAPVVAEVPTVVEETEAHLLAQAVTSLRRDRNPTAAIAVLDRFDQQFPRGILATEARRLRVVALVERAESRAEAGRCRDAIADFDQALAGARADDGMERALYGRGVCWGTLGDGVRARADFASYRRQFPAGKFATEVTRLLTTEPGGADSP